MRQKFAFLCLCAKKTKESNARKISRQKSRHEKGLWIAERIEIFNGTTRGKYL